MNRLQIDGGVGSYLLRENEPVTAELLNDLIVEGQEQGTQNVDILVGMFRANTEQELLMSQGFKYSGSQQKNEAGHTVTYCIFRRCVKRGIALSQNTTLAPTPLEAEACSLMQRRMSEPVDESKWAAMGYKEPEVEIESPLIAKLRKEISDLEMKQGFENAEVEQ